MTEESDIKEESNMKEESDNKNISNVLCLHGCCQDAKIFKSLLKNYIKFGERDNNLKFHFIEAQYNHPDGGKTWYNRPLDVSKIGLIKYDEDLVKQAMEQISTYIRDNNISVLVGFSQGANVVDTYLQTTTDNYINKVVMFSGYSLVSDEKKNKVDISVMNVYSREDTIVPYKFRSTNYSQITDTVHDKGHKLPTSNPVVKNICKFME